MHLLYVDDDRVNLMLFQHAAESIPSLRVSVADSAEEALDLARGDRPDLLVIDLHLPPGNGYELLRQLREQAGLRRVPAFLCTADDHAEVQRTAGEAGFAGVWSKPIDVPALRRTLAALEPAR